MEPLFSNHITTNIITKGWMNISAITKGFILPSFKYIIRKRPSGGSSFVQEELRDQQRLIDDLRKAQIADEEIDYIHVFVNWDKQTFKYGKNVFVELIKKKIEAEISTALSSQYDIKVELLGEVTPKKKGRPKGSKNKGKDTE